MTARPESAAYSLSGYRSYLLFVLVAIYACNFFDRIIMSVIAQEVKQDLRLSDLQIGLLGGLAFALFYSIASLPIARFAEVHSRVRIISAATAVWSLCTALGGFAQSFAQLLLSRFGVGIGEAGFIAPAQSLLADEFPPERRATAISILSIGPAIGQCIGGIVGGYLTYAYGWRMALIVIGLPGVAIALLAMLTLREPRRGQWDVGSVHLEKPSFGQVLSFMVRTRTVALITASTILAQFAAFGLFPFLPSFFMRQYSVDAATAGLAAGVIAGAGGITGALLGGPLADRLAAYRPWLYLMVPTAAFLAAGPLLLMGLSQSAIVPAVLFLTLLDVTKYAYLGPAFGSVHNLTDPRARASVIAVIYFLATFIGIGLGPMVIGALSDFFASVHFGAGEFAAICFGPASTTPRCLEASTDGLRHAMMSAAVIYLGAAAATTAAALTLTRDQQLRGILPITAARQ